MRGRGGGVINGVIMKLRTAWAYNEKRAYTLGDLIYGVLRYNKFFSRWVFCIFSGLS